MNSKFQCNVHASKIQMIPHFNINIELQNKEAKTNFEQINGLVLARYINLGKKLSWPL